MIETRDIKAAAIAQKEDRAFIQTLPAACSELPGQKSLKKRKASSMHNFLHSTARQYIERRAKSRLLANEER